MSSHKIHLPPGDERHGSLYGYKSCGCRCDLCRAANTAYKKQQRATGAPPPSVGHGTYSAYNGYGCRCYECSQHMARRRAKDPR